MSEREDPEKTIRALRDEIKMLEFRLQRVEKIKRTTAIFLDESVAELEAKRKAVEEANTALEAALSALKVDHALERVRSRAVAMQSPEELLDVVLTMYEEYHGLGFPCEMFWHAKWTEKGYEKALTGVGGKKIEFIMDLPRDFSAVPALMEWERGQESIGVFKFEPDSAVQYLRHMIDDGDFHRIDPEAVTEEDVRHSGGFTFVQARTTHGEIGFLLFGETDPSEEAKAVLLRFAKAFDFAYRRFEDLTDAKNAAREAWVNLAVEKVRTRAMAMHRSEEMADVAVTLRNELQGLGVEGVSSSTVYTVQGDGRYRIWDMAEIQGVDASQVYLDFVFHPEDAAGELYFNDIRAEKGYSTFHYSGDRLKAIARWLGAYDPASADTMHRLIDDGDLPDLWISSHPVQRGFLSVDTVVPPSEELEVILPRMASAFDLAYRRFEDLKEAEAATREARIEAALERLRSRTMAMTSSNELLDVSSVMTQLLVDLGMDIHWAYVVLYNEEKDQMETYLTKSTTHPVAQAAGRTGLWTYPRHYHDPDKDQSEFLTAWRKRVKTREANWEAGRFDDWADQFQMMFDNPGYSRDDYRPFAPEGIFNAEALMGPGYVGMGGAKRFDSHEVELLARFAREFEGTYRRFLDIQDAEARSRESKIEAALERVRAQAMAMQKPEDISAVSIRMFDELENLGVDAVRCGISIPGEGDRFVFHAATKDASGQTSLVLGDESVNIHPIIRRAYDGWKDQESFQHVVLRGKDLVAYYHAVFDTMPLPDWNERMKFGEAATESFASFPFQDGWLYAFARHEIDDAELDLYHRFARVFGLAYQRYNDLKQAAVDYQALLAEKARTEKALSDLQATQDQLIQSEKLASLGALTAGIAHEIKNPLNFVNNFAEVNAELAEEARDALASGDLEAARQALADLEENSAQISKHGKRADSIVRAMMQHARGSTSERETIVVNDFLEEYAALAWHGMRARDDGFKAELVRDFAPDAGSLAAMPQELGRVVLNLLNNAFDAVRDTPGARVTLASRRTEAGVEIKVADNGPGIKPEIREKIFEPFFTTKPTGEGTGLGLSLSYDIVTKGHAGTLTVDEAPGGGARFVVTLPA